MAEILYAWAAGVVHYRAGTGIMDWTIDELNSMDRRARKILIVHGCVYTPGVMLPDCIYRGRKGEEE